MLFCEAALKQWVLWKLYTNKYDCTHKWIMWPWRRCVPWCSFNWTKSFCHRSLFWFQLLLYFVSDMNVWHRNNGASHQQKQWTKHNKAVRDVIRELEPWELQSTSVCLQDDQPESQWVEPLLWMHQSRVRDVEWITGLDFFQDSERPVAELLRLKTRPTAAIHPKAWDEMMIYYI